MNQPPWSISLNGSLIAEYERMRAQALVHGIVYAGSGSERSLVAEGLYCWASGWIPPEQKFPKLIYGTRVLTEGTECGIVDLIASMALQSLNRTSENRRILC